MADGKLGLHLGSGYANGKLVEKGKAILGVERPETHVADHRSGGGGLRGLRRPGGAGAF